MIDKIESVSNGLNLLIINGVNNRFTNNVKHPTIKLTVPSFKDPYPESEKYTSKYFETSVKDILITAITNKNITKDIGNNFISFKLFKGFILLTFSFYSSLKFININTYNAKTSMDNAWIKKT